MDTTGSLFMPPAGSTIAGEVDTLFYFITYISIFFFVIIVGGALYFIIKYRRRGELEKTTGFAHNTKLEILWTVIPLIIVMIIFFWGFKSYLKMNVVPKDAIEIKVTAQRWFWKFDYPEGASSMNELVVPDGRPVKLTMSSMDVIHSFYVPDFRIKMDVLPNRYTITWFEAKSPGMHNLFCAEYCGKGHSEMLGKVLVLNDREYRAWLDQNATGGEGMSLEEYGKKLYTSRACNTCHSIDGSGNVGPTFKGIYGHQVPLSTGEMILVDDNYLRESILNPMSKVVRGFQPVMPTYQGLLKARDVDALIAYIKSFSQEEGHQP